MPADEPPPNRFITCLANTEQNLYLILKDLMKVVPAANVEIPAPRAIVTGPKFTPVGLLFGQDHLMVKVIFHPTGTFRLCGVDMQTTVNKGVDAETIWGAEFRAIVLQMQAASSYDDLAGIITSFLEGRVVAGCRTEEPIDRTAVRMQSIQNENTLADWASDACLSPRQFERNFTTRVGISPKLFLRIVRFEYAMRLKDGRDGKTWSEVSQMCGYADSSHLLKEFRQFAAFPPGQLYQQQTSGSSDLFTA